MQNDELHGLIVPVITPLDNEDRVDESSFRKVIRFLKKAGVHGLFVGGSAGEGPLLTLTEWTRMVEIAFSEVNGEIFLLGGVMDTSSPRVLEKIKILAQIGYRNFVVTPTFYLPATQPDSQLKLFGQCYEARRQMQMILYNIPGCVGTEIAVDTMCQAARHGWIRFCKESSGNMLYFKTLVMKGAEVGLKVLQGDEATMVQGLLAGACGIVPVCANFEPETYLRAYQAAQKPDLKELARLDRRILDNRQKVPLSGPFWLSGIKYRVSKMGLASEKTISPLPQTTAEQKQKIDEFI